MVGRSELKRHALISEVTKIQQHHLGHKLFQSPSKKASTNTKIEVLSFTDIEPSEMYLHHWMQAEDGSWILRVFRQGHVSVRRDAQILTCRGVSEADLLLPSNDVTLKNKTRKLINK